MPWRKIPGVVDGEGLVDVRHHEVVELDAVRSAH